MTPAIQYDTLSLLNTSIDGIHVVTNTLFKLMKPIRRKYKLVINAIIILNGIFLYHKYCGSLFTVNSIRLYVGYYNQYRMNHYFNVLLLQGYIIKSDVIKNIQYYRISELGIQVMNDFNDTYQSMLYKWYNDKGIVL